MKKTFRPFLLLCLGTLALTSCKKDDDNKTAATTTDEKAALLTQNSRGWRLTSAIAQNSGLPATDGFATADPCIKDDYMVFAANGTVTVNAGTLRCDPDDPTTETGTWQLIDNGAKLLLTSPSYGPVSIQLDILDLSASSMRCRAVVPVDYDELDLPAGTYTCTLTAN